MNFANRLFHRRVDFAKQLFPRGAKAVPVPVFHQCSGFSVKNYLQFSLCFYSILERVDFSPGFHQPRRKIHQVFTRQINKFTSFPPRFPPWFSPRVSKRFSPHVSPTEFLLFTNSLCCVELSCQSHLAHIVVLQLFHLQSVLAEVDRIRIDKPTIGGAPAPGVSHVD